MKKQKHHQTGFIALISATIIAVVLLLVTSSANLSGFYSRSNSLDAELKERSGAIAEACVDEALLKLANDSGYTGNVDVIVDGANQCHIDSLVPSTDPIIITARADYNHFFTRLEVKVDKTNLSVISWQELP